MSHYRRQCFLYATVGLLEEVEKSLVENQKWSDEMDTDCITYPKQDSPKYKIQSSVNNQHKWVNKWLDVKIKKNQNKPSVNVNTFMSTGHRDAPCNLRPDGDKLNSGLKNKSASCETLTPPAAQFTWATFWGKRIIKWLILTIKQYQFKLIWIFADCTLKSYAIRPAHPMKKGSYPTKCDVNMRRQRWQLLDFLAWKFPSRPESILDNEKWGNFLVDYSRKSFGEKKSVNWTTERGRVSRLHHTLLVRLFCVET